MGKSPRRRMDWKQIRDFKSGLVVWWSTAAGAGLSPFAPGTAGSLVGIPVAYWTQDLSVSLRIVFWLGIFGLGTWAAREFDSLMGTQDNQCIVIDEVVGMAITAWTAGNHPLTWVVAFFAFRFFDVLKPWPIRKVDQWSKNRSSRAWGGFGVMADDVIAGFEGLAVVILLQKLKFLS